MYRKLILLLLIDLFSVCLGTAQVRIRLFASQTPESCVFSVLSGTYDINTWNGPALRITRNDPVLILRYRGRLVLKTRHGKAFTCDSIAFTGRTGKDLFSLRVNDGVPFRQNYSGDLSCYPDLGTLVMVNRCSIESYIAGVVKAEGGSGRNKEYVKSQAILARTYLYRHLDRHTSDGYNLCDNTHCQAFNGISPDSLINRAAQETRGLVILDQNKALIISAFHSNCGGETSTPDDVWLTSVPYLKKVTDPYCLSSRSATWRKSLSMDQWTAILKRSGYKGETDNPAAFTFSQRTRETNYTTGSFSIPLNTLRSELNLRSTFFSVIPDGDSIILRGRGYGHGVGLCQEGAMTMAGEGHDFREIINFYYSGVIITDIKNAVILPEEHNHVSTGGGL